MITSLPQVDKCMLRFALMQLLAMLTVVELEHEGVPVKVDGISVRKKPLQSSTAYLGEANCYSDIKAYERSEPRIGLLARQITSLLNLFEIHSNARPVMATGFRLRSLSHWATSFSENSDPYFAVLKYLSWHCRTDCPFCLHKSDPVGYYSRSSCGWQTQEAELLTRLKYWDPIRGTALPSRSEYNYHEVLTHPKFKHIAKLAREKSGQSINLVTSGSTLSEDMIDFLRSVEPILIGVSLNTKSLALRRGVMRDADPATALKSLELLREREVSFFVSLVAGHWIPLHETLQTITWVDQFDPLFIRINLASFSQFFPSPPGIGTIFSEWRTAVASTRCLRKDVSAPIVYQPTLVEQYFFPETRNRTLVSGVLKNSPAWRAGVRSADEIISLEGVPTAFRSVAKRILQSLSKASVERFRLEYCRGDKLHEVIVEVDGNGSYPYKGEQMGSRWPYGLFIAGGVAPDQLSVVRSIARRHGASNVLLLTSFLVEPELRELLEDSQLSAFDFPSVYWDVPDNISFLGGNVIVGDLLVVDDFVECVEKWVRRHHVQPDLVIIPSSAFNAWGVDIAGSSFYEIEKRTGIHTRMLPVERIESLD